VSLMGLAFLGLAFLRGLIGCEFAIPATESPIHRRNIAT
jgi:hypothetical protein